MVIDSRLQRAVDFFESGAELIAEIVAERPSNSRDAKDFNRLDGALLFADSCLSLIQSADSNKREIAS